MLTYVLKSTRGNLVQAFLYCSFLASYKFNADKFRQSVFQGPPRLTNVHFGAIQAGDLINNFRSLVPWYGDPWGEPVGGVECKVDGMPP